MHFFRNILMYSCIALLPVVPVTGQTITRDAFGVPTITGGDLAEISYAVGQVHAQDRLWQIFLQNIAANGRLAQYLGAGPSNEFIASDTFQRQTNPTDEEVQYQIDHYFLKETRIAFENYVAGLNSYVDTVNADPSLRPFELYVILGASTPIPYFTLYDNLRSARLFLQSFSPTQIPHFQLNNLVALQTLSGTFGQTAAYAIFEDVDPTTSQVRSLVTMMPNDNATPRSLECESDFITMLQKSAPRPKIILDSTTLSAITDTAAKISNIKEVRKRYSAGSGSNGQVIGPELSASGNPLLRCAIQPNFNHPGDFYQVKVDSYFTANYFIVPGIPFGIGMFNNFGYTVQTGHLPTNDFLFEFITDISSSRQEVIEVAGGSPIPLTVYRSKSGGWVIENPVSNSMPLAMLTLRSAFMDRSLQGLNIIGLLPSINSVPEFFSEALKFSNCSDIVGFEGQCADCDGNFGAFQSTVWTKLPSTYDRRLPQGIPFPAPPNSVYEAKASARKPMMDINNAQGYYSGWNNLFKQFAEGSADTITGLPLSRAYWLVDYLETFDTISFDDLAGFTFREALGNSIVAFEDTKPTAFADLFTPLFKDLFFAAVNNQEGGPTTEQAQALALLTDYIGNWFDGTETEVITTTNVADEFILASAWLLNVAAEILNPYLNNTIFEINAGTAGGAVNALPTLNGFSVSNNLATYQGNLLARILGVSSDNTLIYPAWLESVNVDQVIINGLNTALTKLGGMEARPWGAGLRPIYQFKNAIIGTVAEALIFNASGLYFVAEFGPDGIVQIGTTIPLGESGQVLGTTTPVFAPHNFDQLPYWESFELVPN